MLYILTNLFTIIILHYMFIIIIIFLLTLPHTFQIFINHMLHPTTILLKPNSIFMLSLFNRLQIPNTPNRLYLLWKISIIISYYSPLLFLGLLLLWSCVLQLLGFYVVLVLDITILILVLVLSIYFVESHVFHLCLFLLCDR